MVVTGGAGFVGANLVEELAGRHDITRVEVLDDLSTGDRANLAGVDVALHEGSVTDPAVAREAVRGADTVVHLAARPSVPRSLDEPVASHVANATGTLMLLEAVRAEGVGHVVAASSSGVYGANPALPKSEDLAVRPLNPYAVAKLSAESYTLAYQASFGLPALALRFFNVFGPLQPAGHAYAAVVPAFVDAALRGESLTVHGDGKQTRDFTYVGSVVRVLADAVVRRVCSEEPVNLAFGSRRTLLEVAESLERVLDRSLVVRHTDARPGDVRHSQADATRLRELFPDVEPVDFEQGLTETIAWFQGCRSPQPG